MILSLLFPIVLASTIGWMPATSTAVIDNAQAVAFASSTFQGTPLMAVAYCESTERHFDDDGDVLQGEKDHHDIGFMQINTVYHFQEAYALGYDIFTPEGNILFAKWLYDKKGLSPWSASASCLRDKFDIP